jgi:hypothetical protein
VIRAPLSCKQSLEQFSVRPWGARTKGLQVRGFRRRELCTSRAAAVEMGKAKNRNRVVGDCEEKVLRHLKQLPRITERKVFQVFA